MSENNKEIETPRRTQSFYWGILVLFVLLVVPLVVEIIFPLQIVILLLISWVWFMYEKIPLLVPDYSTMLFSGIATVLFVVLLTKIVKSILRNAEKESSSAWSFRSSVVATLLIITGFFAGTAMIGILHQATWLITTDEALLSSRVGSARRGSSKNNLKQIGIASHNFHETYSHFPEGKMLNQNAKPMHGWLTQILPMIDQAALYDQVDLGTAWDEKPNTLVFQQVVYEYLNPGVAEDHLEPPRQYPCSHYAGNVKFFHRSEPISFAKVTDGTSNTIFSGEINSQFEPWGKPVNLRDPALGINKHPYGFGSPNQDGSYFCFVDGSVRSLNPDIDPKILKALSTPAGGETLPEDF